MPAKVSSGLAQGVFCSLFGFATGIIYSTSSGANRSKNARSKIRKLFHKNDDTDKTKLKLDMEVGGVDFFL